MEESPQTSQAVPRTGPPVKKPVIVITAGLLILIGGNLAWHFVPKMRQEWADEKTRQEAVEAVDLMESGRLHDGYLQLVRALSKNPKDPFILRHMAALFDDLPMGVDKSIHFRRQLVQLGVADWRDLTALAQNLLRQDNLEEAKALYEALPKEVRHELEVAELTAALLKRGGKPGEATKLLHEVWKAHPENAECRVKLAGLDVHSPFNEIAQKAVEELWKTARAQGELAPVAMLTLRDAGLVSRSNCEEIMELVSKTPSLSDRTFYSLLDSCVTASPSLLGNAVAIARSRMAAARPEARDYFYQWLSKYNQSATILAEVKEDEAMRSRPLMLAYCDAVLREGRLDQMDKLLEAPKSPLSKVDVALLKTYVAKARSEPEEALRTHLRIAEMQAGLAHDYQGLRQVAAGAENFNFRDIAVSAYSKLATNRNMRLDCLKQVYRLQQAQRDARGMLAAAADILVERPGLPPYTDQADYLKLILGIEMEGVLATTKDGVQDGSPLADLNRALASHLMGDAPAVQKYVSQVDTRSLEAGPRAVFSSLLHDAGLTQASVQLAESIISSQLLPEEEWFLQAALR